MVQVKDTTRTPTLPIPIKGQEELISGMSGMTPKDLLSQYPKFKLANGPKVQVRGDVLLSVRCKVQTRTSILGQIPNEYPLTSNPHICTLINLHYLPPMMRANLMDQMLSRLNNKKMDETTFIKADWEQFKRIDEVFPCVKKYLLNRINLADQDTC